MFTLPILPEQIRVPLDKVEVGGDVICEYPGVVAVVKPLDLEAASRWNDAFPGMDARSVAATTLVFDQLVEIEGLNMQGADGGDPVPFDPKNPLHKKSIPMDMRSAIYLRLRERASVSEALSKNSPSLVVSAAATSGASTTAETVQSVPETS